MKALTPSNQAYTNQTPALEIRLKIAALINKGNPKQESCMSGMLIRPKAANWWIAEFFSVPGSMAATGHKLIFTITDLSYL
jgi:hypothetical protein